MNEPNELTSEAGVDVVVVGAGFAGIYMIHQMLQRGMTVLGIEAGGDVGGTWYWNRYPGARCDVPSLEYSYSFDDSIQQEWAWSEKYATQPEILQYLSFVADRLQIRSHIRFDTRVESAVLDETTSRWVVTTSGGHRISARFCILATGFLSAAKLPEIPGADTFAGETYHTGRWPHREVTFDNKRVGVIGTGSSGIQVIPAIAPAVSDLFVFQRTANFSIPARNAPLDPETVRNVKAAYPELRRRARETFNGTLRVAGTKPAMEASEDARNAAYSQRWDEGGAGFMTVFSDLITDADANHTAADFVRRKIQQEVHDPEVAASLTPGELFIGTKRLCIDTNYYNTFNSPHVTLVDVRSEPLTEITERGIRTKRREYELDTIIFATGFDALTGPLLRMDIRGRNGEPLAHRWANGPTNYLGMAIEGYPNLFMVSGPGSPAALSNVVVCIEIQTEWLAALIDHCMTSGIVSVEAEHDAEHDWVEHVNVTADATLYPKTASWYTGANVPGKPRVFMPYIGGIRRYVEKLEDVAGAGYRGFALNDQPSMQLTSREAHVP